MASCERVAPCGSGNGERGAQIDLFLAVVVEDEDAAIECNEATRHLPGRSPKKPLLVVIACH